jgi:pSer/pThr/pTyr-binding forkhead associated (FHA) protein
MESQTQRRLLVVEGPMEGRSFPLKGTVTTMGRASDNEIVFDSSRISRHHAQIRLFPHGAEIEDLGSTNGTWLNSQRLAEVQVLSSGDLIRLADYVTLRYVQEEAVRREGANHGRQEELAGAQESVPEPVYAAAYEEEPAVDAYEPASQGQLASSTTKAISVDEPAPHLPSRTVYVLVGILVLLICLCVATAVYLWFAPAEFWERVFDWVGIPMPSAYLCGLLTIFRL